MLSMIVLKLRIGGVRNLMVQIVFVMSSVLRIISTPDDEDP